MKLFAHNSDSRICWEYLSNHVSQWQTHDYVWSLLLETVLNAFWGSYIAYVCFV